MPRPGMETAIWWPEFLEVKDEYPLRILAKRYGVSIPGLSGAIKRAGIERKPVRKSKHSSQRVDPRSAEAQEWWDEFVSLKDTMLLKDLAEKFGFSEMSLQRALKRTGLTRKSHRGAPGRLKTTESVEKIRRSRYAKQLGKVPDSMVAGFAGVSVHAVRKYRMERKIPPFRRKKKSR